VTLNELQRGGKLHLVYTGPNPSTIRAPAVRTPLVWLWPLLIGVLTVRPSVTCICPSPSLSVCVCGVQARRPYRQVFLRDVLILCTALIFTPFCSHLGACTVWHECCVLCAVC
jgi:hypothetical protein